MTFCIGIKAAEGLIALADGRITAGAQVTSARKVSMHGPAGNQFLLMTSGLRSVRDKAVAYLEREMAAAAVPFPAMLDAVAAFCRCLRRVMAEDKAALTEGGLKFNLHAILGGQLADDPEPTLFLIYPEGNWIQLDDRTPYLAIGATSYGKPILDRALKPGTSMESALKIAYLSFDSSRVSSADIGFPLDMVTFSSIDRAWREVQFNDDDLRQERQWWNTNIKSLVDSMPSGPWVDALLPKADWA